MKEVGDRGYQLTANETVRLIKQVPGEFDKLADHAMSDTGDGANGFREFIFPDAETQQQFLALCKSVEPPIILKG